MAYLNCLTMTNLLNVFRSSGANKKQGGNDDELHDECVGRGAIVMFASMQYDLWANNCKERNII
jgi:hypothetical protein